MPKFNFKNLVPKMKELGKQVGKNAGTDALNVGVILGGAIASQKMLDFSRLFKNLDPTHWAIKFQGAIKFGAAFLSLAFFSHKMPGLVKMLLYGIMFQGALSGLRAATVDEKGESFFEQIGRGNDVPITMQYPSTVAGEDDLRSNAASAVAGRVGSSMSGGFAGGDDEDDD